METKIKSARITKLRNKCGFSRDLYVEPRGLAGGLALWWHNSISLTVLYKSKNVIHVLMESKCLQTPKLISFVYGPPKEGERRLVWNLMRNLVASVRDSWLLVGDFNDLLSQAEKEGGNPRSMRKILNFQSLLSDCNIMDLEFKGSNFTWCNKRLGATMRERLDKALGNVEFREEFDHAVVFHIDPIGSDHHVLLVDYCFYEAKTPKPFRFEANWVHHEEYLQVVNEGWNDVEGHVENNVLELVRRLDACRKRLVVWSRGTFPNFRRLIVRLKQKLECCNIGPITEQSVAETEELTRQLEEVWSQEEIYWRQRSRIGWLNSGDKNTRFFHSSVIQKRQRNKILRLKDDRDVWLVESGD
ncbi:hypothetical protein QN277_003758 [Acacia crassicarpa]|uniref:Endonuclease/exonuclease/phosphatase domain-containing protein n=1 Tax=Acacia crassicarpa TaxID=499986 RepID=A0AAE1JWJ3_9FABA|nr:hypothetical protein QN277_003758 [Acacia crassicarpa]